MSETMPEIMPDAAESFLKNFISGGLTGALVKTVVAPVERVKLLMQTQAMNTDISSAARYRSPIECVRRVHSEQGVLSFWRGNSAAIARYIPNQALNFSLKDRFKAFFGATKANKNVHSPEAVMRNFGASGAAGAASLILCYPLDMARTRLAADVGHGSTRRYNGVAHCIRMVMGTSGIAGVYKGFVVSLFGAILFRSLYMGGYDSLKDYFQLDQGGVSVLQKYFAAQAITTATGTFCYPIDTVKRRMMIHQGVSETGGLVVITGRATIRAILEKEGIKGFYSGLSVNMIRGIGGALVLIGYDEMKKYITIM
jgi:solute carrier family 25 (adenine nucleotide translocator) protein 4/5/6/31